MPWHRDCGGCRTARLAGLQSSPAVQGCVALGLPRPGLVWPAPASVRAVVGVACCGRGCCGALRSQTHVAVLESEPGTCNFCLASLTSARGSDLKIPRGAPRAVGAVAHPHGDDLPTVVLVLLHLGRRQLAARKRPTPPARHVSGARLLRNALTVQLQSVRPRPTHAKPWQGQRLGLSRKRLRNGVLPGSRLENLGLTSTGRNVITH